MQLGSTTRRSSLVRLCAALTISAAACQEPAKSPPIPPSAPAGSLALLNEETFDEVWTIIRDTHPDPSINQGEWNDARLQFRQRARNSRSGEELRGVIEDMLQTLAESHFAIIPHEVSGTAELTGGWSGLTLQVLGRDAVATRVDPRGPASRAGVKLGWILAASEGDPLSTVIDPFAEPRTSLERLSRERAVDGFIAGRPGMTPRFTFVDSSGSNHDVDVTLEDPPGESVTFGNLPPFPAELDSRWLTNEEIASLGLDPARTGRVGYLRFSMWMPVLSARIDEALFGFRSADAIVVDLRGNPGGLGLMATGVAGHFIATPTSLGAMRSRESTIDFKVNPRTVNRAGQSVGVCTAPLAILIDGHTGSTSEIFAAGLVDANRAECFGQRSAGAALPATTHSLKNGDVLLHAIGDFRTPSGRSVEGEGVWQRVGTPPTRADYTSSPDPELSDALHWIASQRNPTP
jgi:carboxyl-terminal processing protease